MNKYCYTYLRIFLVNNTNKLLFQKVDKCCDDSDTDSKIIYQNNKWYTDSNDICNIVNDLHYKKYIDMFDVKKITKFFIIM